MSATATATATTATATMSATTTMTTIINKIFTETDIADFRDMKEAIKAGWDTGFNSIKKLKKEVKNWKNTIRDGGRPWDVKDTDQEQLASAKRSLAYGLRFQLYCKLLDIVAAEDLVPPVYRPDIAEHFKIEIKYIDKLKCELNRGDDGGDDGGDTNLFEDADDLLYLITSLAKRITDFVSDQTEKDERALRLTEIKRLRKLQNKTTHTKEIWYYKQKLDGIAFGLRGDSDDSYIMQSYYQDKLNKLEKEASETRATIQKVLDPLLLAEKRLCRRDELFDLIDKCPPDGTSEEEWKRFAAQSYEYRVEMFKEYGIWTDSWDATDPYPQVDWPEDRVREHIKKYITPL